VVSVFQNKAKKKPRWRQLAPEKDRPALASRPSQALPCLLSNLELGIRKPAKALKHGAFASILLPKRTHTIRGGAEELSQARTPSGRVRVVSTLVGLGGFR